MGVRRAAMVLGLVVIGVVIPALPAGAANTVGPDQFFTGVVNGVPGNTIVPITIRMACFGPIRPGQTGHPMAGQTLAVHQLFPPLDDRRFARGHRQRPGDRRLLRRSPAGHPRGRGPRRDDDLHPL